MPTEIASSELAVLGGSPESARLIEDWLSPHGWSCRHAENVSKLDRDAAPPLALILLDGESSASSWSTWIGQIREMDGPVSGTPILLMADAATPLQNGISAILPTPLALDPTLAAIEHWCGPLADHAFRDLANPHYRLVRLGGRTMADGLMARFAEHLERALDWIDDPTLDPRLPHQIAGLAGMIGYSDLGDIWQAIDAGDSVDLPDLRARTLAIIKQITGPDLAS